MEGHYDQGSSEASLWLCGFDEAQWALGRRDNSEERGHVSRAGLDRVFDNGAYLMHSHALEQRLAIGLHV